jgi:hypothetical protein
MHRYAMHTYMLVCLHKDQNHPLQSAQNVSLLPLKIKYAFACTCIHAYIHIHTSFSRLLKTNWFTPKLPVFDAWAKNMCFEGGGYAQNAVIEGLAAALDILEPELPPAKEAKPIEKHVLRMSQPFMFSTFIFVCVYV